MLILRYAEPENAEARNICIFLTRRLILVTFGSSAELIEELKMTSALN
jgi:hypothetical protein